MAMTIEIITKETIKPSSPTPPHLNRYYLSLIDQVIAPDYYVPLLIFYAGDGGGDDKRISQRLKSSLSQVLTNFYPLAGRLKDNSFYECNDEGVEFIETRVNCSIYEILQNVDYEELRELHPFDTKLAKPANEGPLMIVQANFLKEGGVAISICFSHKLVDASSMATLINNWAAITRENPYVPLEFPKFSDKTLSSLFPPADTCVSDDLVKEISSKPKLAMRRIVFHGSKIAELKVKAASERVPHPSRVEVVSTLLWKCAMVASRSNFGFTRPSIFGHLVNLRKKMVPPLPHNFMGNIYTVITAEAKEGDHTELPVLVSQFRRKIEEITKSCGTGDEASQVIFEFIKKMLTIVQEKEMVDHVYFCSSWCKFPWYEADFGWGKPIWVSSFMPLVKNSIQLIDSNDGEGIEAWVTLSEEDMSFFEKDQDLLEFASLNPSPLLLF